MTTTLITGANKGLGYETARRLIEAGHSVWMGARDATRGQQAADALGGRFVQLDVTSDASVAGAAKKVAAAGGLDVLINNAGISGPLAQAAELTAEDALGGRCFSRVANPADVMALGQWRQRISLSVMGVRGDVGFGAETG